MSDVTSVKPSLGTDGTPRIPELNSNPPQTNNNISDFFRARIPARRLLAGRNPTTPTNVRQIPPTLTPLQVLLRQPIDATLRPAVVPGPETMHPVPDDRPTANATAAPAASTNVMGCDVQNFQRHNRTRRTPTNSVIR